MSGVEQVRAVLAFGADTLEGMPAEQLPADMRKLHTGDALGKVAAALLITGYVSEAVRDIVGPIAEIGAATGEVRAHWVTALNGSNSPQAAALLGRIDTLMDGGGEVSVSLLIQGGIQMEEKVRAAEAALNVALQSLGELDELRGNWQFAAELFAGEVQTTANEARMLAGEMGGVGVESV